MPSVRITRAASAHPANEITQAEAINYLEDLGVDRRRASAVARGSRIGARRTVLPPAELARLGSIEARNRVYREEAPALATSAAGLVMDPGQARTVSQLVTSSCTGYDLPGLSSRIVQDLCLPLDIARVPLTESGCAGGVVALTVAADYLRARPGKVSLALAAELCSLAFHPSDDDGSITANLIFGDGAGAARLEHGSGPGLEVVDSASMLIPGSSNALGFVLADKGFVPVLDRCLPEIVPPALECSVTALLGRHGLTIPEVATWLVHPGGARILDSIQSRLGAERSQLGLSWDSLRQYGNTSSAAIFDVVARYFERPSPPGSWVVIAAFGPGVSVDLILGRQSC